MFGSNALDELKRANHLVYVTLKYTRTCEVMKSAISRMISAFDEIIEEGLEKKKAKITDLKTSRAELFYNVLNKRGTKKYFGLYFLLRKLDKAKYTKKEEYRKHVTLIAKVNGRNVEVDIPKLYEYYEATKEFVNMVIEELK